MSAPTHPNRSAEREQRFLRMFTPLEPRARRVARRLAASDHDGGDLFQDAVLRAFEKCGDLRDEERFASWFFAILFQTHRARARYAAIRRIVTLEAFLGDDEPESPPTEGADEVMIRAQRFQRALAMLSPAAREAIVAFELEGMTLEELAAVTGDSVNSLSTRLSRARASLRQFYERSAAADELRAVGALSAGRNP